LWRQRIEERMQRRFQGGKLLVECLHLCRQGADLISPRADVAQCRSKLSDW
jgi:hypothetical protein